MTNDEILTRLNEYLDQHISGIRGALRQDPYMGDIFKLFAAATATHESAGPNSPQITNDGLVEDIGERSQQADTPEHHQKKLELLRRVGAMWSEWDYAWRMYSRYH